MLVGAGHRDIAPRLLSLQDVTPTLEAILIGDE
jgi:hypothetical protein